MMENKDKKEDALSPDQLINLMSVYLAEFEHRDQHLWAQSFKFFYATLVIMLLPNISDRLGIDFSAVPSIAFRVMGFIMSLVFLYASLGYAKRLEASTKTYRRMMEMLPEQYQRTPLKSKEIRMGRFFQGSYGVILSILLFASLLALDAFLLIFKL